MYQLAQSNDSSLRRQMRISKPLGRPTIDCAGRSYGDFEIVVLIAEGIGITPWLSVLQQLSQREHHVLTRQVTLIWSVRSTGKQGCIINLIVFRTHTKLDILDALLAEFQDHLTDIDCILKIYLTRDNSPDLENAVPSIKGMQLAKGRPDYATLLREIHCENPTTDVALGICAHSEAILKCGNMARAFSNEQSKWAVRCERFEL